VTAESGTGSAVNYGFLFGRDGGEWFLNDGEVVRELGRRLGDDLDPVGYAEVLGEFYSAGDIDRKVVEPVSITPWTPAGELVTDVAAFTERYPYADPGLVAPPKVRASDGEVSIDFYSYRHHLSDYNAAVDVLKWTVVGGGGRPASWSRTYVMERLTEP
jgi:hypothetical protein